MHSPLDPRAATRSLAWGPAIMAVAALVACSSATSTAAPTATARPAAVTAKAKAAAKLTAKKIAACEARKPGAQIYVRDDDPGAQVLGQELGGHWRWNYSVGRCQSALDFTIAAAGQADGECTTIGYVADNPGWNPNAIPAPKLKNVAGEAGPGC